MVALSGGTLFVQFSMRENAGDFSEAARLNVYNSKPAPCISEFCGSSPEIMQRNDSQQPDTQTFTA